MNANLKEYIRLCSIPAVQEKIREGMGEWRIGDMCVVLDELALVYGIIPATSRQGRRIYIRFLSRQDFDNKVPNPPSVIAQDFDEDANKYYLRIPQAIDLQNPERGLWGMFQRNTLIYLKPVFGLPGGQWPVDNDNTTDMASFHTGEYGCKIVGCDEPFIGSTPALALLKAIAHQLGVEVEQ